MKRKPLHWNRRVAWYSSYFSCWFGRFDPDFLEERQLEGESSEANDSGDLDGCRSLSGVIEPPMSSNARSRVVRPTGLARLTLAHPNGKEGFTFVVQTAFHPASDVTRKGSYEVLDHSENPGSSLAAATAKPQRCWSTGPYLPWITGSAEFDARIALPRSFFVAGNDRWPGLVARPCGGRSPIARAWEYESSNLGELEPGIFRRGVITLVRMIVPSSYRTHGRTNRRR